jgi:hypothetical protein
MGALFGSSGSSSSPPPPPPPPPSATPPTYASSSIQGIGRKPAARPNAGTQVGGANADILTQTPVAKRELLGT